MEAAEKLGIESLKEATLAVAELSTGIASIVEGGLALSDLKHVPKVISGIRHASKVKLAEVIPQAKDLDDAEKVELSALFKESFDIVNDDIEKVVEEGLAIVLEGLQALLSILNIGAKK